MRSTHVRRMLSRAPPEKDLAKRKQAERADKAFFVATKRHSIPPPSRRAVRGRAGRLETQRKRDGRGDGKTCRKYFVACAFGIATESALAALLPIRRISTKPGRVESSPPSPLAVRSRTQADASFDVGAALNARLKQSTDSRVSALVSSQAPLGLAASPASDGASSSCLHPL